MAALGGERLEQLAIGCADEQTLTQPGAWANYTLDCLLLLVLIILSRIIQRRHIALLQRTNSKSGRQKIVKQSEGNEIRIFLLQLATNIVAISLDPARNIDGFDSVVLHGASDAYRANNWEVCLIHIL